MMSRYTPNTPKIAPMNVFVRRLLQKLTNRLNELGSFAVFVVFCLLGFVSVLFGVALLALVVSMLSTISGS